MLPAAPRSYARQAARGAGTLRFRGPQPAAASGAEPYVESVWRERTLPCSIQDCTGEFAAFCWPDCS